MNLDRHWMNPATQFEELYLDQFQKIFANIYNMVRNTELAKELTQQTFEKAFRARFKYKPTAPPGAWLSRIGVNISLDHMRREAMAKNICINLTPIFQFQISPERKLELC